MAMAVVVLSILISSFKSEVLVIVSLRRIANFSCNVTV